MAALSSASLVDGTVGGGEKSGYDFATDRNLFVRGSVPASFAVTANPSTPGAGVTQTGTRSFCTATDGIVMQYKPATPGAAAPTSTMAVVANAMSCNATGGEVVE